MGVDACTVDRLCKFWQACGLSKFVYMSDQETSLHSAIQAAVRKMAIDGQHVNAVPEHSAIGESQSNGRAEAAVQAAEDMLRTHTASLEGRLQRRIPSKHPMTLWLCEYVGVIITKYVVGEDGCTAYEHLHGHKISETCGIWGNDFVLCPQEIEIQHGPPLCARHLPWHNSLFQRMLGGHRLWECNPSTKHHSTPRRSSMGR